VSEAPTIPPSADPSRGLFELITSRELDDLSADDIAEMTGVRDAVDQTLEYSFPPRQEPKNVRRSPIEHLDMVRWERKPLVDDVAA
jgi:hypothetical protein